MLPRTLEPEVMDTALEAFDYDTMDHSTVNRTFVDDFLAAVAAAGLQSSSHQPAELLDVGTGTAQIPVELCFRDSSWQVLAVDMAGEMLKLAARNVSAAGLGGRIQIAQADAKGLPYDSDRFLAVVSNSIVHHIPEPRAMFAEAVRVLRPGGLLFVRDLLRPADAETVEHLVAVYAGTENAHQQQMFRDSLHAALTLEEVREMVADFHLPPERVQQTSDRHWTLCAVR